MRREALGFACVGIAGFVVDAGLTILIVHWAWLEPAAARIPATIIAVIVTFVVTAQVPGRC